MEVKSSNSPGINLPSEKNRLEFKDISYSIEKKLGNPLLCWKTRPVESRQILRDISGFVDQGDMMALMGASGAGKSTMLNVLSRRIQKNKGTVLFNNQNVDSIPSFSQRCCFIQQEDLFHGTLTVAEHLSYQARMRMNASKEVRQQRLSAVIEQFRMNKIRETTIGNIHEGSGRGISGGEKKRLAVASELLVNPEIIFADEPTSGLDTIMAESVVESLQLIADSGHTIVATIHQPSSHVFARFNKLLLLAEGRMVYCGPREAAMVYFMKIGYSCPPFTNPADYFIDLLAINWENPVDQLQRIDHLAELWKTKSSDFFHEWETELKQKMIKTLEEGVLSHPPELAPKVTGVSPKQPSLSSNLAATRVPNHRIFWTLINRTTVCLLRDPAAMRARWIQTVVSGLLTGFVYFQLQHEHSWSKSGAAFFILLNQGFMSMFGTLGVFIRSKDIILREHDAGLFGLSTYYFAKVFTDTVLTLYQPLLFTAITWFMVGLNPAFDRFLLGWLFIFLVTTAVASIAYFVGSFAPHLGAALALGPVFLMPMLLVSGFIINHASLPSFWVWLKYMSPFTYGFSGIMRAVFLNVDFNFEPTPPEPGVLPLPANGNEVLARFQISVAASRWGVDIGAIIGFIVILHALAAFLFSVVNRTKKR